MMSQTETLLLFVLGSFVTLFIVLLFGRGLWAMIGSWSGWREARQVPAAIRELQAERDSLKAEKAMMAQKLEASINDIKMRMAEQTAEVSRNRNRLLDQGQTLKEREATIAHLQAQFQDQTAQNSALQSQIEENVKSINLAYAKMAQREEEHLKMQNVLKEAQATLLLRDEKIRNQTEESKALRELVVGQKTVSANIVHDERPFLVPAATVSAQAPIAVAASANSFEARFANGNSGNPLLGEEVSFAQNNYDETNRLEESNNLDRGVSNVLSLAERVRGLQTGMKKA
jgi:hypothetical protein